MIKCSLIFSASVCLFIFNKGIKQKAKAKYEICSHVAKVWLVLDGPYYSAHNTLHYLHCSNCCHDIRLFMGKG